MTFPNLIFKATILALCLCVWQGPSAHAGDPVVTFGNDDVEMNTAIQNARATLDDFLDLLQTGGFDGQDPALKVAIPYGEDNFEHIWVGNFQMMVGGKFQGQIGNDPVYVTNVKLGDQYVFGRDQVSDWMYFSQEKIHGAYTLRVILPQLPEDQAAGLREALAPLPK